MSELGPSDLASAIGLEPADAFPPVFSTSRMVALMELAAARVLRPHLRLGELSVGVSLEVVYTAATPPGATVTATARFLGREGKLFLFEVSAADNAGEIGRCTHKRAVVTATSEPRNTPQERRASPAEPSVVERTTRASTTASPFSWTMTGFRSISSMCR